MVAPATPGIVMDTGLDGVVQSQRRSSMHRARLQRLSPTDALEGVSGPTSTDVRQELSCDPMTSRHLKRETPWSGSTGVAVGTVRWRRQGVVTDSDPCECGA